MPMETFIKDLCRVAALLPALLPQQIRVAPGLETATHKAPFSYLCYFCLLHQSSSWLVTQTQIDTKNTSSGADDGLSESLSLCPSLQPWDSPLVQLQLRTMGSQAPCGRLLVDKGIEPSSWESDCHSTL